MAPALVRVVCLTFLTAGLRSCTGSESSETLVTTDFSITIPKEGLQADVQKTFHLGPSQTLGVFDFSNTASYLPALPASESGEGTSDQVASSAFVFENGKCNFDRVIGYKQLFPGYDTPLWVRGSSPAKSEGDDSATVTTFKFTNPPEENLYGGVSFCVRFKSVRLPTGSTDTLVTTQRPTSGDTVSPSPKPPQTNGQSGAGSQAGAEGSTEEEGPAKPPLQNEGTGDGHVDGDSSSSVEGGNHADSANPGVGETTQGDQNQHNGHQEQEKKTEDRVTESPADTPGVSPSPTGLVNPGLAETGEPHKEQGQLGGVAGGSAGSDGRSGVAGGELPGHVVPVLPKPEASHTGDGDASGDPMLSKPGENVGSSAGPGTASGQSEDDHKVEGNLKPGTEQPDLQSDAEKHESSSPPESPLVVHSEHDAGGDADAPMRRLAVEAEENDTFYLTIVVHSAAWRLASGAAVLLVSLSAMASALLQAF